MLYFIYPVFVGFVVVVVYYHHLHYQFDIVNRSVLTLNIVYSLWLPVYLLCFQRSLQYFTILMVLVHMQRVENRTTFYHMSVHRSLMITWCVELFMRKWGKSIRARLLLEYYFDIVYGKFLLVRSVVKRTTFFINGHLTPYIDGHVTCWTILSVSVSSLIGCYLLKENIVFVSFAFKLRKVFL